MRNLIHPDDEEDEDDDDPWALLPEDNIMKQKVAYIAGPMRGIPLCNFPAFDQAAEKYRARGWLVYSPAEFDREFIGAPPGDCSDETMDKINALLTIRDCMSKDMDCICNYDVDTIVLLKGWERSMGVKPEAALGLCLSLDFIEDETGEPVKLKVTIEKVVQEIVNA